MAYFLPAVETREQWSAIFRDMALWEPVVAEICSQEGLRYSHVEASYPGTNAVFLLDRRFALKVYCPLWPDFSVERELHVALAGGVVPLPKLVSSGRFVDRIPWNYLVTEFLDGVPVRELRDALRPDDLVDVAAQLGAVVRALHDTDLSALEHVRDHETGPQLADRRKVELVSELRSKALLTESVLGELESFMDAAAAEAQHEGGVLVHGDLTEDHLLLARQVGRRAITGLLDFGDAHVCPREYDWPALWIDMFRMAVRALRAFFDAYDPETLRDEDFRRRAFVWTLFHDFGSEIVEDALARRPGTAVGSIDDLRELLWPAGILGA